MRGLDSFDDGEEDGTVFRDLVMLTLLGFATMVVLMLPHLAPPTQGDESIAAPGNLIVEARWPDDVDVDVDLWVKGPNDQPVGFSNSNGLVFDLLRDDLGFERDGTGLNYEFAFSRGAPAGEYIVNIHLYSNRALVPMVPVKVHVALSADSGSTPQVITDRALELHHASQEITVVRFTLDDTGHVVGGSVNELPMALQPKRNG